MFKIGDFSRIAQTPVSQLRYYANIGLFEPEAVDPSSGYRYYTATQLPRLNRILALKDLGLTLEQIREALSEDIVLDEVRGMLRMHKAKVEQSLNDEWLKLKAVEARLKQIETQEEPPEEAVVLKSIPAQTFLSLRESLPVMMDALPIVNEMMESIPDRMRPKLGYLTSIVHGDGYNWENVDMELGFTVDPAHAADIKLPGQRVLAVRELPAVETMATVARIGPFYNNCLSYGALGGWLENGAYDIAGPAREVLIQPPNCDSIEDSVAEIQVPVTPSNAVPLQT